MKASFESLNSTGSNSFLVRKFEEKRFSAPYHFHPEYELTLITEGYGKRYVGTNMQDYLPGDLVLLGSNLPHCWKTEEKAESLHSASVVVQFKHDFMGAGFFEKPEMKLIQQLLNNSKYGIQFKGDTVSIRESIAELPNENNSFSKFLTTLNILHRLAQHSDFVLLDQQNTYPDLSLTERERINAVIAYIVENFQTNISLANVAATANMTAPAFCKYFKKISRKTFIEAVTDYRIDFALKQLVHTEKSIAQIGFESGFNDISNFHKTFKARMRLSPLSYRNTFMKKLI
jgi:AraC-like DNA-binding protein/quercetin dioxygenase-like cupin family protein